jgi:hypothetical protein
MGKAAVFPCLCATACFLTCARNPVAPDEGPFNVEVWSYTYLASDTVIVTTPERVSPECHGDSLVYDTIRTQIDTTSFKIVNYDTLIFSNTSIGETP